MFKCHSCIQIQGESNKAHGASTTKYRGVFGTITTIVRAEGLQGLYNGLVAGLQRQMSFASVRIGLYDSMKQFYTRGSESECCFHSSIKNVTQVQRCVCLFKQTGSQQCQC